MAVLRSWNVLGQQRVDAAHLRSLESAAQADMDLLAGSIVSGGKTLVVRGFDLIASTGPATALQLNVAGGILMHQNASEAGTIFSVVDDATVETLDGTNPNVSGSFTPGQVNYVGLDLVRAADSSTSDLVMFWDPNSSDETPKTVPLARTLGYRIVISTTDFDSTPNILPIAKVTTTSLNVVASVSDIVDARQLAFRLGSGGSSPDKGNAFAWPEGRDENTATTGFSGADKAISSLKDWMDAAMTRLWELGGGEFWYSPTADRNLVLVSTGTVFANGENFSWDGTNLTWQGLQFLFDNSTGWYNEVKAQTASSAGLTDLADGECIYVDLDRSQNLSGASALVAAKAPLTTLGPGSVPGARQVIAWRRSTSVFTRGSKYPVGAMYNPASTTALGVVKLSRAPTDPNSPTALTDTEKNAASGVAALDASRNVIGVGLTRDSAGTLAIGTGANDSAITISKAGALTTIAGTLSVTGNVTTLLTCGAGVTISGGDLTVSTGKISATPNSGNTDAIHGVGAGTGAGVRGEGGIGSAGNGVYGVASSDGVSGGAGGYFAALGPGSVALHAEGDAVIHGGVLNMSDGRPIRSAGLASAPGGSQAGDRYYDTTLKVWRVYFADLGEWSHTVHTPTLINSYSSVGSGVKYWMDCDRVVHMKGAATNSTANTNAFQLPVGWRPVLGAGEVYEWVSEATPNSTLIDENGYAKSSGTTVAFDNVTFSTIL